MALEQSPETHGHIRPRSVERGPVYIDRGDDGVGSVMIGVAVLALVAIIAFFLLSAVRQDTLRTSMTPPAAQDISVPADPPSQP
jgi:hypothetical protein